MAVVRRGSRPYLEKAPERKERDLDERRLSCAVVGYAVLKQRASRRLRGSTRKLLLCPVRVGVSHKLRPQAPSVARPVEAELCHRAHFVDPGKPPLPRATTAPDNVTLSPFHSPSSLKHDARPSTRDTIPPLTLSHFPFFLPPFPVLLITPFAPRVVRRRHPTRGSPSVVGVATSDRFAHRLHRRHPRMQSLPHCHVSIPRALFSLSFSGCARARVYSGVTKEYTSNAFETLSAK